MHESKPPSDLAERRNLLRGPAWEAVVVAVVAEAEMLAELDVERWLAAVA